MGGTAVINREICVIQYLKIWLHSVAEGNGNNEGRGLKQTLHPQCIHGGSLLKECTCGRGEQKCVARGSNMRKALFISSKK